MLIQKALFVFTFCCPLTLNAQTFPLGPEAQALGVVVDGPEVWGPLHLSARWAGGVALADVYKGRVVLADAQGRFERAVVLEEGLSPALNYFAALPEGGFTAIDRGLWKVWGPDGRLQDQAGLPIGVMPQGLWVFQDGVVLKLPVGPRGAYFLWSGRGPLREGRLVDLAEPSPEGRRPGVPGHSQVWAEELDGGWFLSGGNPSGQGALYSRGQGADRGLRRYRQPGQADGEWSLRVPPGLRPSFSVILDTQQKAWMLGLEAQCLHLIEGTRRP